MRDADNAPKSKAVHLPWLFATVLTLALIAGFVFGTTLGTFFAGVTLVTLVAPWAAAAEARPLRQWMAWGCVTDAVAGTWLVIVLREQELTLLQWVQGYCVLLSLALGLWGVVELVRLVGLRRGSVGGVAGASPDVFAGAIASMAGILWLTAPLWLLHHLQTPGRLPWMARVIEVHPLFAINGVFPLGVWSEFPLAYRMLNLNQDVFYALPETAWPSVLVHAAFGAIATGGAWLARRGARGQSRTA